MKRNIWLILIMLSLSVPLTGQEIISSIRIEGTKRTRDQTVLSLIKVAEGDRVTEDLVEQVEQRLRRAGIFQDELEVTLMEGPSGEERILRVFVQDRWTLIGMPFFSSDKGKLKGGLFAVDSNLLGTGNLTVASLLVDSEGSLQGFFIYRDPTFLESSYQFFFSLAGGKTSVTYTSLDGTEEWEDYSTLGLTGSLGLGYQFSDAFNLTGSLSAGGRSLERGELPPPGKEGETVPVLGLTLRPVYDGRYRYSLFSKGFLVSLEGKVNWAGETGLTGSYSGTASYSFVLWEERLMIKASAKEGLSSENQTLGGAGGSMTLPTGSVATECYFNGELLAEVRALSGDWGSVTTPLYYEAGWLVDYRGEEQPYHGVGGGFRFYLAKVAAPALGLDYRHNFTTDTGGLSFFIGMAF